MKLQEIVINNFMPYKGEQIVQFPQHETQNVMLLYGDNMRGKTSFLNAIRWGFYGLAVGRHLRTIPRVNLVNIEAASVDDWSMSILLKFTHEEKSYELRRKITKKSHVSVPSIDNDFEEVIGLKVDGEVIAGDKILNQINQVSPEEISRFFLFDGELLQEYENLLLDKNAQGEKIKLHIEQALGVPSLINGRADFSVLLQESRRKQTRDANNSSELKSLATRQSDLDVKEDTAKVDLNSLKEQKSDVELLVDGIDDKLKNTEAAQRSKAELDVLTATKKATEDNVFYDQNERRQLLKNAWKDILYTGVQPVLKNIKEQRSAMFEASNNKVILDSKILELEKSLLDPICPTCSQSISETEITDIKGQIAVLKAEASLSFIDIKDIRHLDNKIEQFSQIQSQSEGTRFCELVKKERKSKVQLMKLETNIDEIEDEISGFDTDEISRQRNIRDNYIKQLSNIENDISTVEKSLEKIKKDQTQISNVISKSTQGTNSLSSVKVDLYQSLESVFSEGINELRDSARLQVEKYATNAFSQLTTEATYSGLEINQNYGLTILDHQGRALKERSAGAEQIVALSLIDGLNRTARKSGPIIMDTPLGRLDPKHRANVLKYLPKMADQVVLLVHEGEIDPNKDLENFKERIGARYAIERISSTQSRIIRSH
ncbi:hypothetical protein [Photobacterium piscicola]|uniref:hypothetical protein n=1 Tax=Photobacterium piscicola TaxID=1378299 RepID=UPI0038D0F7DE